MSELAISQRRFEDIAIECEARRICDERGIDDSDSLARICTYLRHQECMRSIEQYLKLKTRFFCARMIDRLVMDADGSNWRVEYKPFSKEAQDALDSIDELISSEAKRWSFEPPSGSDIP